jgi:hypothetical protein
MLTQRNTKAARLHRSVSCEIVCLSSPREQLVEPLAEHGKSRRIRGPLVIDRRPVRVGSLIAVVVADRQDIRPTATFYFVRKDAHARVFVRKTTSSADPVPSFATPLDVFLVFFNGIAA